MAAVAIGLAACGGGAHGPGARVAHAELYKTGNGQFDEFFEDLYDLQQRTASAAQEERNARGPLMQLFGVEETPAILQKLKAKVDELGQGKQKVKLEMDGLDEQGKPQAGKLVTVRVGGRGKASKDAAELAATLDASVKAEGAVWEKFSPLADKSRRMLDKANALSPQIDQSFESKEKRDEVRAELDASKRVLSQMALQLDKTVMASVQVLKGTAESLSAAASSEPKKDKDKDKDKAKDKKPTASPPPGKPAKEARETKPAKEPGETKAAPAAAAKAPAAPAPAAPAKAPAAPAPAAPAPAAPAPAPASPPPATDFNP
jgi:hypothetical protein